MQRVKRAYFVLQNKNIRFQRQDNFGGMKIKSGLLNLLVYLKLTVKTNTPFSNRWRHISQNMRLFFSTTEPMLMLIGFPKCSCQCSFMIMFYSKVSVFLTKSTVQSLSASARLICVCQRFPLIRAQLPLCSRVYQTI